MGTSILGNARALVPKLDFLQFSLEMNGFGDEDLFESFSDQERLRGRFCSTMLNHRRWRRYFGRLNNLGIPDSKSGNGHGAALEAEALGDVDLIKPDIFEGVDKVLGSGSLELTKICHSSSDLARGNW
jgi:hypothetical protein